MVRAPIVQRFGVSPWPCVFGGLLAILAGCSQREEISRYEEPAESEPAAASPSMAGMPSPHGQLSRPSQVKYDTPAGWQQGKTGGMRKAAFVVESDAQKVDITVIDLAAQAGVLPVGANPLDAERASGDHREGQRGAEDLASAFPPGSVQLEHVRSRRPGQRPSPSQPA